MPIRVAMLAGVFCLKIIIMPTYWESFIRNYEKEILTVNTYMLLQAFWLYCNSHNNERNLKKCNDIMGRKV